MERPKIAYPRGWKSSFIFLWLGSFITGLGYSMTMPFVSLFMATLGHYSRLQLNLYSGLAFAMTFTSQAIVSPYWGYLADRKGRKPMCLRAAGVMSLTIFITGFAQSAAYIIIMRFIQGLFSGYINNAIALIASETPHRRSGWVISQIMTAGTAGSLVGPLLGGALSNAFGYRIPFFITGLLMFSVFLTTLFFVHEYFKPVKKEAMQPISQIMKSIPHTGLVIVMFVTTMLVQASNMSIDPIVSLYVKDMLGKNATNIAFIAGVVAAAPGLGTLLSASKVGHTMDNIGPCKVLIAGLVAGTIVFVPMALTHSPWVLAGLRFILGIASAGMIPAAQTILTLNVPAASFGRVFSYNQSFQAVGSVAGSLMGSAISGLWSYPAVFLATGAMLGVNLVLVLISNRKQN